MSTIEMECCRVENAIDMQMRWFPSIVHTINSWWDLNFKVIVSVRCRQANFRLNCCHFNYCRKLKIIMQNFMSSNDKTSKATAGQVLQNNSTRKLTSHIHLMNFNCVTRESFTLKGYHIAPSPALTLKTFHIHKFPAIFFSSCAAE